LKKIKDNIGICEKRQFFRRKLGKIAENCDHNIDPGLQAMFLFKLTPTNERFPLGVKLAP
jgi:hypothetical protein